MTDAQLQMALGALVTIVTNVIGFAKLARKLEAKADKAEVEQLSNVVDLHDRRLAVVERARS